MHSTQKLTSRENPNIKRWISLHESKGIKKNAQFLVFGKTAVDEILQKQPDKCLELIHSTNSNAPSSVPSHIINYEIPHDLFLTLDLFGTHHSLLVCQSPQILACDLNSSPTQLEVLCPLGDPANVGALLRSCAGFGLKRFVLLKECANPLLPKSIRSCAGGIFDIQLFTGPAIDDLINIEDLMVLDMDGTSLEAVSWPKNARLLVGEEGPGIASRKFKNKIKIPLSNYTDSLNATVAASIAIYDYRKQHPIKGSKP